MVDYYLILGIPHDANLSQIKRAYRLLCLRHPDQTGEELPRHCLRIREAYDTLSNRARRADYDRQRSASPAAPVLSSRPAAEPIMNEPISLFRSFTNFRPSADVLLDRILHNFVPREPKSHAPRELSVEIVLSPEQAASGGSLPIEFPLAHVCQICAGTGYTGYYDCEACAGHGIDWAQAHIDVLIPRDIRDGQTIPVSLRHLGVANLFLNLHVRVARESAFA